jgi:hypothetical protein
MAEAGEDAGNTPEVAVVGLGYVGLPLAVALARHDVVLGFDVKAERIAALQGGVDSTGEVAADALAAASLSYSADPQALAGIPVYIVAVPTPVDATPPSGPTSAPCCAPASSSARRCGPAPSSCSRARSIPALPRTSAARRWPRPPA